MISRELTNKKDMNEYVRLQVEEIEKQGIKWAVRERFTVDGVTQIIYIYDKQLRRYVAVDKVKVG